MTANAMSGERERCLAAGMNDHISKPIDPDLLALTLAQWLTPVAGGDGGEEQFAQLRQAGIDAGGALERLHGNGAAYARLLTQLLNLQHDFAPRMQAALARGETELARRLAHHLQGLAANCGAQALAASAAQLGHCLAAGDGAEAQLAQLAQVEQALAHAGVAIGAQGLGRA